VLLTCIIVLSFGQFQCCARLGSCSNRSYHEAAVQAHCSNHVHHEAALRVHCGSHVHNGAAASQSVHEHRNCTTHNSGKVSFFCFVL
jgi:hypothetical protein